jgi:hypothetical protein
MIHVRIKLKQAVNNPVSLIAALFCFLMLLIPQSLYSSESFPFYAVYHKVAAQTPLKFRAFYNSLMSRDGKVIFIYGQKQNSRLGIVKINTDGSNVREITIPDDLNGIHEGTISGDGSRLFLKNRFNNSLYKVENNRVIKIFDANAEKAIRSCDQIQSTTDGEWVYFVNYRSGIWKVRHDGSSLQEVVKDNNFSRESGKAAFIHRFSVSGSGRVIAAIIQGYMNPQNIFVAKHDLFVYKDGGARQLSNDDPDMFKDYLAISGDGNVIAYSVSREFQMHAYNLQENRDYKLSSISSQIYGLSLNHDGTKLFYFDQTANGGRLVNTDGTGGLDLFPVYNVGAIALQAPRSLGISQSGKKISFRFNDGVYVGHINPDRPPANMPAIESIAFDPPLSAPASLKAETILKAVISHPLGKDNIIRVSTNELMDGRTARGRESVPHYFYSPVSDSGHDPDKNAGDGMFTGRGKPGNAPDAFSGFRVRIGAMDKTGSVVVADTTIAGVQAKAGTDPVSPARRVLSADQQKIVNELGWPDTFILFFDSDPANPQRNVTYESWNYHSYITRFDFADGVLVQSDATQIFGDLAVSARKYRPLQFSKGMDISSIQALFPDMTLAQSDIPELYGQKLLIMTGDRIMFGFEKGKLQFVETTLIVPEGGVQ